MDKLIFVYNADSGLVNMLMDGLHKMLSPSTYECNLCTLTWGNTGMKKEWKEFVNSLDVSVEFLHKDELHNQFEIEEVNLPAVFKLKKDKLRLIITAQELNGCVDLNCLMNLVNDVVDK